MKTTKKMQPVRSAILAMVAASLLLVTACSGTPAPNQSSSQAPSATASASATDASSPAPSATPSPSTTKPSEPAQAGVGGKQQADVKTAQAAAAATALDKRLNELGFDPSTWNRHDIDWAKNAQIARGGYAFNDNTPTTTAEAFVQTLPGAILDVLPGSVADNLNPANWVPLQATKNVSYSVADGMAYLENGTVKWGATFIDPAGAVVWANVVTGAIDRELCKNPVKKAPVATELPPTITSKTPPKKEKPPVPETLKVCIRNSGDQTLVTIDKKDFNPATMSTNPADCVKPFVCKPGTFPNPSNPKDCLDSKDPALSPPPADGHTPAPPPVGKTPLPTPTSNQIDPTTPVAAPAPPVTQAPDTTPTPTTPLPPVEAPAPTGPTTPIADPDQPTVAASVAVPAVQQSAPVAAPAPVAKAAPVVVQAAATVAAAPAPATTAPAVHATAPAGATSAPVAAAPAATSITTVAAAPAAHVGG